MTAAHAVLCSAGRTYPGLAAAMAHRWTDASRISLELLSIVADEVDLTGIRGSRARGSGRIARQRE